MEDHRLSTRVGRVLIVLSVLVDTPLGFLVDCSFYFFSKQFHLDIITINIYQVSLCKYQHCYYLFIIIDQST